MDIRLLRSRRCYFNSRPSARGDATAFAFAPNEIIFQFTPLREGRRGGQYLRTSYRPDFNSRPSARGDARHTARNSDYTSFQFTPLREGRRMEVMHKIIILEFQFTPLREGRRANQRNGQHRPRHFNSRPSARGDMDSGDKASNKANFNSRPSARGDAYVGREIITNKNFNSRPSARGDGCIFTQTQRNFLFQFTPLREGRHRAAISTGFISSISIHAPPRGATRSALMSLIASLYFNSRPSARGDSSQYSHLLSNEFQFTPLREGRLHRILKTRYSQNFNSRPSARGDRTLKPLFPVYGTFQFTPLREGRPRGV